MSATSVAPRGAILRSTAPQRSKRRGARTRPPSLDARGFASWPVVRRDQVMWITFGDIAAVVVGSLVAGAWGPTCAALTAGVGACAVALAGGAVGEEERGLTATVLSGPVSRRRWLAARALVAAAGGATMLMAIALGLAASAVPALMAQDSPATVRPWVLVGGLVAGLAAQLPAVLLSGAWLLALHSVVPRLARPLGWGAYLLALSVSVLGPTARAPQWLLDLSPFTHVPQLPVPDAGTAGAGEGARLLLGEGGPWIGPAVCAALAVVLMVVADAAGRRRDLTA